MIHAFFQIALCMLLSTSCRSQVVNPDNRSIWSSSEQSGNPQTANQQIQDAISRSPSGAIEGRVQLDADLPIPLSGVLLGLYNSQGKEISLLTTDTDGSFRITQKLRRGKYELRILDRRYHGQMAVDLEDQPVKNLVFLVNK